MRKLILLCCLLVFVNISYSEEDRSRYRDYFERAAAEFNVPADLLKGIAFAETRWSHLIWADGDTVSPCNGMPRPYGVMSLWDNEYFGHSLRKAAALLGLSIEELKRDSYQNIRGAAALLRQFYAELPRPEENGLDDIESWRNAIAAYSGLPQTDLAQQHALDIYTQMTRGYHAFGIEWDARSVNLEPIRAAVAKIREEVRAKRVPPLRKAEDTPDYPLAKWAQAAAGHWYTSGYGDFFVVIHDMEGYYLSTISYFQNPSTQASAHFCINGLVNGPGEGRPNDAPAGEITQMVELKYWAWHVVCWNKYMIGIEHEGFANTAAWYSKDMYDASGKLTAWLCNRFSIPKDRNHVIAHGEWQNSAWKTWMAANWPQIDVTCNSHTDPGIYWDWNYYMSVLKSDTLAPQVTSAYPSANATDVPAYKDVVVTFSSYMDSAATNKAFSINPIAAGTKSWSPDFTTFRFHPSDNLAFSTTYVVTIDSTAKSVSSGKRLSLPFQFLFTTVKPDTLPPVVIRTYPRPGDRKISILTDVFVTFDKPLKYSSLTGRITMTDSSGVNVPYTSGKLDSLDDHGIISFSPSTLKPSGSYTVKLAAGLIDLYGNQTTSDYTLTFNTSPEIVMPGIIFDGFESNTRGWTQPLASSKTVNADVSTTTFSFSGDKKMDGSLAGKLVYGFTKSSGGVIYLEATGRPTLDAYSSLGVWVAGDESGNQLEAVFQPSDQLISLATIDWRGWKFLFVPLSSVTGSGKQLSAFVVRQMATSSTRGTLYFDDIQLNSVINGVAIAAPPQPTRYTLEQNYPNPFNPVTSVQFSIPGRQFVSLKVHDVLGRIVATLVNRREESGTHVVRWDARNFPSGVYFYTFWSGDFVETRKMILQK